MKIDPDQAPLSHPPTPLLSRVATLSMLVLVWGTTVLACGESGRSSTPSPSSVQAVEPLVSGQEQEASDSQPPSFDGLIGASCTSWGRIELEWAAATDNRSSPHEIRYRVEGFQPARWNGPLATDPSSNPPVITSITEGGAVSAILSVPVELSLWRVIALDAAGNESSPGLPRQVLTRPRPIEVSTGAVEGALTGCERFPSGPLVCTGENGRFATLNQTEWQEGHLPASGDVRLVPPFLGQPALLLDAELFQIGPDSSVVRLSTTFEEPPRVPWRRAAREPTGLLYLLDSNGSVWASADLDLIRLDNPLLTPHNQACDQIAELAFTTDRGFAWCRDGRQFALRAGDRRYQWTLLPETSGLPLDPAPQRRILLQEGRRISMLTHQGVVYRYDLGGWRQLYPVEPYASPATAMTQGTDPEELVIAAGGQILTIHTSGEIESMAGFDLASPIIHLEISDGEALAITSLGEVLSLPGGQLLRGLPSERFSLVVRRSGSITGTLCQAPQIGLYQKGENGWSCQPLPALPREFVPHSAIQTTGGALLLAGDGGARGGRILQVDSTGVDEQAFLYPPPPPPVTPEDQVVPPGEADTATVGEPQATPILTGVAGASLPEPPPPPPPVRAIDLDETSGTRVAAGEGGSLWLGIEGGWLRVESGVVVPLLSTAVIGDHRYVAGGVQSTLVTCERAVCTSRQLEIGDIRRLIRLQGAIWAIGSSGVATSCDGVSWERTLLSLEEPYPTGRMPTGFLAIVEYQGQHWLLADDGSIWREEEGVFRAMALVEQPLGLSVDEEGQLLIWTERSVYTL
ncbi:MAG: hypothetical protein JW797_04615 [Bradymonadales bacterium]|nr:hypothetical protein [Bradymonadales bacterium]